MSEKCPICQVSGCEVNAIFTPPHPRGFDISCKNCGQLFLTIPRKEYFEKDTLNNKERALLSYAICKMQKEGEYLNITHDIEKSVMENESLPNPAEQADNFILWLGNHSENPAEWHKIFFIHCAAKIGAFPDIQSVGYIIIRLWNKKLIESKINLNPEEYLKRTLDSYHMKFRLTFDGWEKYEELKRGISESKKVFMAMPFKGIFRDKAYETMKKAASRTGFELSNPLLELPKAGLIDDQIRVEIRKAKFVAADLTNDNRGVYWEAGFAEGLGKKVIYTCHKKYFDDNKIHFDTDHLQTVHWEENSLDSFEKEIKAVIRNTFPSEAVMDDEVGDDKKK